MQKVAAKRRLRSLSLKGTNQKEIGPRNASPSKERGVEYPGQ